MSKYLRQRNVKLSPELDRALEDIAEYEGVNVSELIRTWIRREIQERKQTRAFQAWLRKREMEEGAEAEGEEAETGE